MNGNILGHWLSGRIDEASSEMTSHNFLLIDLDCSSWIHVSRSDLIEDWVDRVCLGQMKPSYRLSNLRRSIADIARGSIRGEMDHSA